VLTAGVSDSLLLSDLFYADEYDVQFASHSNVSVNYFSSSKILVLKSDEHFEGFALLPFKFRGREHVLPVYSNIKARHVFKYQPAEHPRQGVFLMGSFNDWNRTSLPLTDEDGDGTYTIELALEPGQYYYQLVLDRVNGIPDPANPEKVDNGFGGFNSVLSIPPRHTDKTFLQLLGYEDQNGTVVLKFRYERANQAAPPRSEDIFAILNNQAIQSSRIKLTGNEIALVLPKSELRGDTNVRVIVSQSGQPTNLQTIRLGNGKPVGGHSGESRWHDAVIYSLMIDRFRDGDSSNSQPVQHDFLSPKANYLGGDLQGVVEKIENGYFDSLGVNVLWISPVNDNTDLAFREWPPPHRYFSAYHGYWPVHHRRVEEKFGDLQLLKKLVTEAHAHGIKVLLDFIAHHVHIDHPFYKKHPQWFGTLDLPDGRKNLRMWDEFRLTTWFEPYLPTFDYLNSDEAVEVMTDNAIWWLNETGADGFRHDAVKHIPNRFWRELTRKIKQQVKRPIFQIGETFGSYDLVSSYVNNGQLDAQFNFNLYDAALYVFLNPEVSFEVLDKELQKTFSMYGVNHLMGNVMDSHDKVRYMAYADGDIPLSGAGNTQEIGWANPPVVTYASSYKKVELYLAYMMTTPGIPVLYYGDEIGLTGAADPDNRRPMRFGEQLNESEKMMLRRVREVVKIRKNHSALRYGDFQTLLADERCFVFLRSDMNERILVTLNKSEEPQTIEIELPDGYDLKIAIDVIAGSKFPANNNHLSLSLPALEWRVLKIE
jgi:glycosidase